MSIKSGDEYVESLRGRGMRGFVMGELVEEGRHGWHTPLGDAGALGARLASLIHDRQQLAELYAQPVELPTWEGVLSHTLETYDTLLSTRSDP